jgi:hypothetical protein
MRLGWSGALFRVTSGRPLRLGWLAIHCFPEIAYRRTQGLADVLELVCSKNQHRDDQNYQKFLPANHSLSPSSCNTEIALHDQEKDAKRLICLAPYFSVSLNNKLIISFFNLIGK